MKKNIALLLLFITTISNAQYKFSDFVFRVPKENFNDTLQMIRTMPESVERAMLEQRAFTYYYYTDSDSSIYFGKRVEAYAKKHNIPAMLVFQQLFLGQHYSNVRANPALGLYYVNSAIAAAKENNLSDNFIEGMMTLSQLIAYSGIGSYTKVKKILAGEGRIAIRKAYFKENIWTPEGMMAQIYGNIKEYDSAIRLANIAIKINDSLPLTLKWGYPYIVLGNAYINKQEYQKALDIINKGKTDINANKIEKDLAEFFAITAEANFGLRHYDSALYYVYKAYNIAQKVKLTNTLLRASTLLSKIYVKTNQIDSAFKYSNITNLIKDELSDKSKLNEIENITLNEQLRQQQKEEAESKRKKLIIGFALLFIIGFSTLLIYTRIKQKNKIRQIEDDRKNKELQAAKDLQISLLPKSLPYRNDLDIATFIRSSTEVGGDYYDFEVQNDGTLVSICGDATGHGVTSGMMVSITKAGIKGIGKQKPSSLLNKLNNVIKDVDLGILRMSLNIAAISNNEIELASAAMPPVYLYKACNNSVEEIMIKGLPLGGLRDEDFKSISRDFETGDVLVQLSDGLPEAPNAKGELYDYERLKNLLSKSVHLSAKEIIEVLIKSVDEWMEGKHNPDDITLVVTKKK